MAFRQQLQAHVVTTKLVLCASDTPLAYLRFVSPWGRCERAFPPQRSWHRSCRPWERRKGRYDASQLMAAQRTAVPSCASCRHALTSGRHSHCLMLTYVLQPAWVCDDLQETKRTCMNVMPCQDTPRADLKAFVSIN